MSFIITIAVVAVLALFIISVYNGLVKERMQTQEAWSQIDVQLKRRNDLLPNLIETVKGYGFAAVSPMNLVIRLSRTMVYNGRVSSVASTEVDMVFPVSGAPVNRSFLFG